MSYDIIPIGIILIISYILSYALYRKNKIKKSLHNKIWNIVLLMSFLISAGMGALKAGLIDFSLNIAIGPDLIYWHGEIGIILFLVLLFHLQSNWSTFKKLLSNIAS